jgi:hypothetical protein
MAMYSRWHSPRRLIAFAAAGIGPGHRRAKTRASLWMYCAQAFRARPFGRALRPGHSKDDLKVVLYD